MKTLKELHAELDAAAEAYEAAAEAYDAVRDAAWDDYCRANEDYKKKLKENEDETNT